MRASDIGIVSPVDGALVTSGGAAQTVDADHRRRHPDLQRGQPRLLPREHPERAVQPLHGHGQGRQGVRGRQGRAPDDYLPWGAESDLPAGKPANTLTADFGSHATNWTFENGSYVNQNSYAGDGDEFPADSVLVLRVDIGDAGYTDPAGNPVPETIFEGEGNAFLFHAGKVVEGTWTKDELGSALQLATKDGKLKVPAGRVLIELVPIDAKGGSVTLRRSTTLTTAEATRSGSCLGVAAGDGRERRRQLESALHHHLHAGEQEGDRALDELGGLLGVGRGRDGLAGRRHRAEEDPGVGLQHRLVELPLAGLEDRLHDVEHVGEGRALLLLAEALVAEHSRALLDDDPAVARLLHDREERAQSGQRLDPRVLLALQRLLDPLRRRRPRPARRPPRRGPACRRSGGRARPSSPGRPQRSRRARPRRSPPR